MAKKIGLKSVIKINFGRAGQLKAPKKYYKVSMDGNCFFRCISYILTGSEDDHLTIREQVVNHMSKIQATVTGYLDEHPDIYISHSGISNDCIWATDKEIMTTANLLECDIVVYTLRGNTKQWLTYPASFSILKTIDRKVYLENVGETHYDVVTHI